MSEGPSLPWKQQTIDSHRGPACDYSDIRKPLPRLPKGKRWIQNKKTRDWTVEEEIVAVADGTNPIDDVVYDDSFLEHYIQPNDTFQGLCLKYKISSTQLRQANNLTGPSLMLAPNPLKIPLEIGVVIKATEVIEE